VPTPGAILNIGTADGQNHFNVGIGRPAAHTDYDASQIAGGYSSDPEFIQNAAGDAVQFRVRMDAKTTSSGTKYPRSELRELNEAGTGNAAWDGSSGTHYMEGISRVTHLPPTKPWAVFCQIHDASSDLIRVQTEGSLGALKLVARNTPPGSSTETVTTVQASYTLGTDIVWRLEVIGGSGKLYLGGTQVLTFPAGESGCYFKAGCYAQSNSTIDSASEYAAVELRNLKCWHTGYPEAQGSGTPGGGGGGTTPPATVTKFKIGLWSCLNNSTSAIFDRMRTAFTGTDRLTHLVCHGDFFYDDTSSGHTAHWNAKISSSGLGTLINSLEDPDDFHYTPSDHDSTFQSNGTGVQYPSAIAAFNSEYRTKWPNRAPQLPSNGIYHTWVEGRVRFIVLDERTFKSPNANTDNSSKTVLGATQKTWFKNLIASADYPLIVVFGDNPVVGTTTAGDDGWKGYNTERQELATALNASPVYVIRTNGDMHCLAISNNQFGYKKCYQSSPAHNDTKVKESGAGLTSSYPTNGSSAEGDVMEMFGVLTIEDNTQTIAVTWDGYSADGTKRLTDTVSIAAPTSTPGTPPPGDPIYNVRSAATAIVGNANATPVLPASLTLGDLLIVRDTVIRFSTASQPPVPGTPAGWTQKATNAATLAHASIRVSWYYARWDPSGVNGVNTAPTITYAGIATDEHHAQIVACSRAWATGDPTDVIGAFGVAAANSSSVIGPAPGITLTKSGDLVLGIIACEYDPTAAIPAFSGSEGLSWVMDDQHGDGNGNTWGYGFDHAIAGTAVAIADKNLSTTLATSGKSVGQMWAIKPASAGTSVGRTATVRWQVKKRVPGTTAAARWQTKAAATGVAIVRWRTRSTLNVTRRPRFKVRALTAAARVTRWRVRNTVPGLVAAVTWSVRKRVGITGRSRWSVRKLLARTRQVRYRLKAIAPGVRTVRFAVRVRTRVTGQHRWSVRRRLAGPPAAVRYRVRGLRPVTRTVRYRVRAAARGTRPVLWSVRNRVRAIGAVRFGVRVVSIRKLAPVTWRVRGRAGTTRTVRWRVRGLALAARTARWATVAHLAATRAARWSARAARTTTRTVRYGVRVPAGTLTAPASWSVRRRVRGSRVTRYNVTGAPNRAGTTRTAVWNIRAQVAARPRVRWQVRTSHAENNRVIRWRVASRVGVTRRARWHVRAVRAVTRRARWSVRFVAAAVDRVVVWDTHARLARTGRVRWSVRVRAARARVARWRVRVRVTTARTARWSVRATAGRVRGLLWRTRALQRLTGRPRWSVRVRVARARVVAWSARQRRRGARVVAYDALARLRVTRAARWGMRRQAGRTVRVRWAINRQTRVKVRTRWRVVRTADQALTPGRLTATVHEHSRLGVTAIRTEQQRSQLTATVKPN
jgi:hypothetical protein